MKHLDKECEHKRVNWKRGIFEELFFEKQKTRINAAMVFKISLLEPICRLLSLPGRKKIATLNTRQRGIQSCFAY
jgi:hypothetical protein